MGLEVQANQKKNQLLNYLDKESTHKKDTFNAIPNGVLKIVSKLTSITEEKAKMSIN